MGQGKAVGLVGLTLLLGCGGNAEREKGAEHQVDGGTGGGGAGDGATGGAPSEPPACEEDEVRCNVEGVRERCSADGSWVATDFVCATALGVDDEVGSYCATKADGSYRCWGGEPSDALPAARYQRVQLTSAGLIGLTSAGELLGAVPRVVQELPRTTAFNATNMWGHSAVCALGEDGSLRVVSQWPDDIVEEALEIGVTGGPFSQAFCVFEGLTVGVLTNGSLWTSFEPTPAGSDWQEVAMSLGIFCGITRAGGVVCQEPFWQCDRV